jgi:hypothetical protein
MKPAREPLSLAFGPLNAIEINTARSVSMAPASVFMANYSLFPARRAARELRDIVQILLSQSAAHTKKLPFHDPQIGQDFFM